VQSIIQRQLGKYCLNALGKISKIDFLLGQKIKCFVLLTKEFSTELNILDTVVRLTLNNTPIAEYDIPNLILVRKIINLFSLLTVL